MDRNKSSTKSADGYTLKKQHSEAHLTHLKTTDEDSENGTISLPTRIGISVASRSIDNTSRDADRDALCDWPPPNSTVCAVTTMPHSSTNISQAMSDALIAIADKYEIQKSVAQHLLILKDYEIVIVIDDSGSMGTPIDRTKHTRWDELCDIVKIVLEVSIMFQPNGIDVYFINGREHLQVTNPRVIDDAFKIAPRGYTPLVRTLERVFQLPATRHGHNKKLLVFVATDGAPTDDDGNEIVPELEQLMQVGRQVETTYVSFLLCTDEPSCIEYTNKWDRTMKNVDVTADFRTVRNNVWKYRGQNYQFSFGDYIVKALVGAIVPEIDKIDEPY